MRLDGNGLRSLRARVRGAPVVVTAAEIDAAFDLLAELALEARAARQESFAPPAERVTSPDHERPSRAEDGRATLLPHGTREARP